MIYFTLLLESIHHNQGNMGAYPGFLAVGLCLVLLSVGGGWNSVVEAIPMNPTDMTPVNSHIDTLFTGLECPRFVEFNVKDCVADLVRSSGYWDLCSIVKDARDCYTNGFDACRLDPLLKADFLHGYDKGLFDSDECSTSSSFTFRSSPYSVPLIILGIILVFTSLTKLTFICCKRANRTSCEEDYTANLIK